MILRTRSAVSSGIFMNIGDCSMFGLEAFTSRELLPGKGRGTITPVELLNEERTSCRSR